MRKPCRGGARLAEASRGGEWQTRYMFFVYILKSINYSKTYTGRTENLEKRLKEHNAGYNLFSKRYKPWRVIYFEEVDSLQNSIDKEKYFKSKAGRNWIKENLFN